MRRWISACAKKAAEHNKVLECFGFTTKQGKRVKITLLALSASLLSRNNSAVSLAVAKNLTFISADANSISLFCKFYNFLLDQQIA